MKTATDRLMDFGYEDVIIFENPSYDDALVGVTTDDRAVYDFRKMVEWLMKEEGMDDFEAVEFIEYNTIRSLGYVEGAPVIMYELEE